MLAPARTTPMFPLLPRHALLIGASLLVPVCGFSQTLDPDVAFTVSADLTADPGQSYSGFHAAGAGLGSEFAIGFMVDITSVNGSPITLDPITSFCIELAEPIGLSSYVFDGSQLYQASAGLAGAPGTASSNIPVGGIGALRAARVRYLFDNFYQSMDITQWRSNGGGPVDPDSRKLQAFQLALWETSHDSDLSLTDTAGAIYITGTQGTTLGNAAVALAQNWLDAMDSAGITESYVSTTYDVWALTSSTGVGGGGNQDVMLPLLKGSPAHSTLVPLMPVPEPSSAALCLLGTLAAMRRRRD